MPPSFCNNTFSLIDDEQSLRVTGEVGEMASEMTVASLGRPFGLGMLYDARKDALIPGMTLWDEKTLQENTAEKSNRSSAFNISASDSIEDKSFLLDVSASLKLSFCSGLIEVGGSAKYLNDEKKFKNQSRVTCQYKANTNFKELSLINIMTMDTKQIDVIKKSGATHVVTGIQYGANAFFVFDSEKLEASKVQNVQGNMQAVIKKIPTFSIEGKAEINLNDQEKDLTNKFSCKFFGDFILKSNPVTFEEAVKVYAQLPQLLGEKGENAVPLKVWLMPLKNLDTKAAELSREISNALVERVQDALEDLSKTGIRCNDSLQDRVVENFPVIREQLSQFQKLCSDFATNLRQSLAKKLPSIRDGKADESSVEELFEDREKSPFSHEKLSKWLDDKEREINVIRSCVDIMEGVKIVRNQTELDREVLAPGVENALCFVFTSMERGDTYLDLMATYLKSSTLGSTNEESWYFSEEIYSNMRNKAKAFRDFAKAQKNNNRLRILIATIANEKYKGATIYHYKEGILVSEDFTKLDPPDVETITDREDLIWCLGEEYCSIDKWHVVLQLVLRIAVDFVQTHSEDTGGETEAHGGSKRGHRSQDEVVVNNSAGELLQFGVESSTLVCQKRVKEALCLSISLFYSVVGGVNRREYLTVYKSPFNITDHQTGSSSWKSTRLSHNSADLHNFTSVVGGVNRREYLTVYKSPFNITDHQTGSSSWKSTRLSHNSADLHNFTSVVGGVNRREYLTVYKSPFNITDHQTGSSSWKSTRLSHNSADLHNFTSVVGGVNRREYLTVYKSPFNITDHQTGSSSWKSTRLSHNSADLHNFTSVVGGVNRREYLTVYKSPFNITDHQTGSSSWKSTRLSHNSADLHNFTSVVGGVNRREYLTVYKSPFNITDHQTGSSSWKSTRLSHNSADLHNFTSVVGGVNRREYLTVYKSPFNITDHQTGSSSWKSTRLSHNSADLHNFTSVVGGVNRREYLTVYKSPFNITDHQTGSSSWKSTRLSHNSADLHNFTSVVGGVNRREYLTVYKSPFNITDHQTGSSSWKSTRLSHNSADLHNFTRLHKSVLTAMGRHPEAEIRASEKEQDDRGIHSHGCCPVKTDLLSPVIRSCCDGGPFTHLLGIIRLEAPAGSQQDSHTTQLICTTSPDCTSQYSQLWEDIQRLKSELRKKNRMIEGYIAVAAARSKQISFLRLSGLAVTAARSPTSSVSVMASTFATTLPWLPSLYADVASDRPEGAAAETGGLPSEGLLDVGTPGIFNTAAAADQDITTPPSAGPEVGSGNGPMVPVYSSTPKLSELPWTAVASRGRKGDPDGRQVPPVALSNRFAILMEEALVHPGDAPAVPALAARHATAASPPPAPSNTAPPAAAPSPPSVAGGTAPPAAAAAPSPVAGGTAQAATVAPLSPASSPPVAVVATPVVDADRVATWSAGSTVGRQNKQPGKFSSHRRRLLIEAVNRRSSSSTCLRSSGVQPPVSDHSTSPQHPPVQPAHPQQPPYCPIGSSSITPVITSAILDLDVVNYSQADFRARIKEGKGVSATPYHHLGVDTSSVTLSDQIAQE
ncbi:hypothetical protein ABVT39_005326 [Epinephelus coioides]